MKIWDRIKLLKILLKYRKEIRTMFKLLKKIRDFVSGYKVYIVGCTTILGLAVAYSEGTITGMEFFEGVMVALGAMGFRSTLAGNTST